MSPIEIRSGLRKQVIPPGELLRLINVHDYSSILSTEEGAIVQGNVYKGENNLPPGTYIINGFLCRVFSKEKK